jgi:ATP-dependent DNA helicase RecG
MAANLPLPGERLARILRAERAHGAADRTVYGGIDALLKNLLGQAGPGTETPILTAMQCLGNRRYAQLDRQARLAWIDRVLALIERGDARPRTAAMASSPAPTAAKPAADSRPRTTPPATQVKEQLVPVRQRSAAAGQKRGARVATLAPGDPVTKLPGVGSGRAAALARLDIATIRDLLFHFPHRHEDFSRVVPIGRLVPGIQATIVGRVWSAREVQIGRSFARLSSELIVGDETGNLRVVFFNNPYPARQVRTNDRIVLSGRVAVFQGRPQLESPEWELIDAGSDLDSAIHAGRLVPVYPLTQGVQNRMLRTLVRAALDACADQLVDPLPEELRAAKGYPSLPEAIRQIHFPDNAAALERARERLAYDELFELQVAVLARRAKRTQTREATPLPFPMPLREAYERMLPFPLTSAQRRAIAEILGDLTGGTPMARLLQGDVGSGKTVVAAAALLAAATNGCQSSLMAPTEILAEQHFRTLRRLLGTDGAIDDGAAIFETDLPWLGLDRPLRVALLRGGLKAAAKRAAQQAIATGMVDIAIGTQALIQEGVQFQRLALTIIDEQHRFGVLQRSALAEKGANTHMLVMTATPIPRTLQLSIFGDLDVSIIDEMPPGRLPVRTKVLKPSEREFAYRFIREEIEQGHQAFIICPLVEESETLEARAATEEYERLRRDVFPDLPLLLLHGRMPPDEKDAVMRAFRDREAAILVATSVIEVGIDIPNTTVILIEGADRFGLAQLHQFRGRVGRGGQQAFCLLLSDSDSMEAAQRLALLERISDGFRLAEADLRLRGAGDYFGVRQSGLPALKVARLTDTPILEAARADAARLIAADPLLQSPRLAAIRARIAEHMQTAGLPS